MENVIEQIKLSALNPSSLNPRKTFDDASINELAESIKNVGVLQPLIVRQHKIKGMYEIVCGDRRFRASMKAKIKTVPCIEMTLTDDQAVELMITENLQRKDIHPLEEAEAFSSLINKGTYDIASLCQRFGKSETYIRHRVKLNDLIDPFKQELEKETINLSMAFEICKIKQKYQLELYNDRWKDENRNFYPKSVKDIVGHIERNFTSKLSDAPFSKILKFDNINAPVCIKCLLNTACNMSLFPDAPEEGICMDKECYDKKSTAHLFNIAKEVQEKNPEILILQSEYNYSDKDKKTVSDLIVEGIEVNEFPKQTWTVDEPELPLRDTFDEDEEGDQDYKSEMEEYVEDLKEYEEKIASGKLRQALMVTGREAGKIVYLENKATDVDNIIPAISNADINIKNQIKELQDKEKRNYEIYFDKTYQEIMKSDYFNKEAENNYFSNEAPLTEIEEKALFMNFISRITDLPDLMEKYKDDIQRSYYVEDDEKLKLIEKLTDAEKNRLLRVYIFNSLNTTVAWPTHDTDKILIEVAREFNPDVVNQISLEKQGKYLKQKETILKKIEELESKLSK